MKVSYVLLKSQLKKVEINVRKQPAFEPYSEEHNITIDDSDNTFSIQLKRKVVEKLTFYGIVSDAKRLPIQDVKVQLQLGSLLKIQKTDENGYYNFEIDNELRFAHYSLQFRDSSYAVVPSLRKLLLKSQLEYQYNQILLPFSTKKPASINIQMPALVLVYDDKEKMVEDVEIFVNDTFIGIADKTIYLNLGRNSIELRWQNKTYKDVITIQKDNPVPKLMIPVSRFN